jgi:ArsR family transcriptional regulator
MDSGEFLDLLGNANRRRILRLLARKPCYVTEISEQLGVSPKAVIDHLGKLEEAGLIESRTDDRRRKYFSISQHVSLEVTVSPYNFGTRSAYPSSSRVDVTSCRQVSIELESLVSRTGTTSGTREEKAGSCDRPTTGGRADADSGTAADEPNAAGGDGASARAKPADGAAADSESDAASGAESRTAADGSQSPAASSEMGPQRRDAETGAQRAGETAGPDVSTLAQQLQQFEQLERELSLLHRWAEGRITGLRERLADRVDVANPRLVSELLVALAEEPHQVERLCRRLDAPPPVVEELLDVLASEGVVRREGRHWTLVE